MIVWGGYGESQLREHRRKIQSEHEQLDKLPAPPMPLLPDLHTRQCGPAAEMIVWGGFNSGGLNTGGRYDPNMDRWMPTGSNNAPSAANLSHRDLDRQ